MIDSDLDKHTLRCECGKCSPCECPENENHEGECLSEECTCH